MKKFILMTVAMIAMSISTVSAQSAMILLQHNGSAKMYTAEQLTTAINAAVAGDTIYLTKGSFGDGSEITINKAITIIGAGGESTDTYIKGNLTIAINGTPTLTSTLLEGVYLSGNIYVKEPINGLKIKRSSLSEFYTDAITDDTEIVQCYIRDYIYGPDQYLKKCAVINSKLKYLNNPLTNTTFLNCNIYYLSYHPDSRAFNGNVINSIIYHENYSPQSSASFTNCLYYIIDSGSFKDCYKYGNTLLNSTLDCILNKNTLLSNNYLGNDGTVVGIEGGTTPFTLVPSGPQIESSTVKVDVLGQKLNVSLKVKAD